MTASMTSGDFFESLWVCGIINTRMLDPANEMAPACTPPLALIARKSTNVQVVTVLLAMHFSSWTLMGRGLHASKNWSPLTSDLLFVTWRRSQSQGEHAGHTIQLERIQRRVKDGGHYHGFGWLCNPMAEVKTWRLHSRGWMKVSLDIVYIAMGLTI